MAEDRPFNPLEGFARALTGFSSGLQGRPSPYMQQDLERERMAQQQGQFEQTLKLQQQQFAQSQAQFEKNYKLASSAHAASILKSLTDNGVQLPPEEAAKVGKTLLDVMLGGLAIQGDTGAQAILQEPGVSETIGRQLFTGGLKLSDLAAAYPLVHPTKITPILRTNRLKQENIGPELIRVGQQEVDAASNELKALAPQIIQSFRTITPAYADPKILIPEGQLITWLGSHRQDFLEALGGKYTPATLNAAVTNLRGDSTLLEGLGVLSGKTTAAVRQAELEATSKPIQEARIAVSAATGLKVEEEKRKATMNPETRAQYVHIPTLMQSGELQQPPEGMTQEAINVGPYASISAAQKERLSTLAPSLSLYNDVTTMGKSLITATTGAEAFQQGVRLTTGALTGENAVARAYQRTKDAFTDTFGRTFGGARGVISDRDTARFGSAFASLWDTTQTAQLKDALTRDVMNAAKSTMINEISGKPTTPQKSLLQAKLDELDAVTVRAALAATPAGQIAVRNPKTFEIKMVPTGKVPAGWTPLLPDVEKMDIPMGTRVR